MLQAQAKVDRPDRESAVAAVALIALVGLSLKKRCCARLVAAIAEESNPTGALLVGRAQAELASEEQRGSDLLLKLAILTALAAIELTGGIGIVSTELHNHLPLEREHIALPLVGGVPIGSSILAVLIILYAVVLFGAGAGLLGLIASRYTGKRSGEARIQRVVAHVSQVGDPSDLVTASQLAEIQRLVTAHVRANDRREALYRRLVLPAVAVGVLAAGGLAAILGAGPVRPTDVRVVSSATTITATSQTPP